jgi:PAS domain S-box-containing protein
MASQATPAGGRAGPPPALRQTMPPRAGWSRLFRSAFVHSRNAMTLLDAQRRHVDVNGAYVRLLGYRRADVIGRPVYEIVVGGPLLTDAEWAAFVARGQSVGETELLHADGRRIGVQWAASVEVVTGRHLVLFVALSTSRWGPRYRRDAEPEPGPTVLTRREREIVRLVALGSTANEIADELHLAHNTVRTHIRNAMAKLGARSRAHLVARALAEGLALD